ncbi:hypothetical protein CapIbe_005381 [Capra ibex]
MNGTLKKPTRDAFRSWWNIYYAAGISVDRDTMSLHIPHLFYLPLEIPHPAQTRHSTNLWLKRQGHTLSSRR